MEIKIYIVRDEYGRVLSAAYRRDSLDTTGMPTTGFFGTVKTRRISTWKDLVCAMLQSGTSMELFDRAWKLAIANRQVTMSWKFADGDYIGADVFRKAMDEALVIDGYISELVNNPKSKFYIYG